MLNKMMLNEDTVRALVMAMEHPQPEWNYQYVEGKEKNAEDQEVFFCRIFLVKPDARIRIVDLNQVVESPMQFSADFRSGLRQALVENVFFAGMVLHERMHEEKQMMENPKFVGAAKMRWIGDQMRRFVPGLGFVLHIFEFNKPGLANYISNANRDDVLPMLETALKNFKAGTIKPTQEEN